MATIVSENAKQIRMAMSVEITMQTSETARLSSASPVGSYKIADTGAIYADITMRKLADLQDDGFPLNGEHALYDENLPMSTQNGKVGIRGTVGQNLVVQVTASQKVASVTIKSENVSEIIYQGNSIPAIGLDVVYLNATSGRITFVPKDENSRVFIDYIEAGVELFITNDTLIRCGVNLRSNLSPDNPSWEASDIEIQAYYPYDISDSLAHVQDEWPIIYRAGYPGDMSPDRKFYLSEPAVMENNVLTMRGVDATPKLESYELKEGDLVNEGDEELFKFNGSDLGRHLANHIRKAGIQLTIDNTFQPPYVTGEYYILPQMTLRDCIQGITNLTADLSNSYRIAYIDAGRPTLRIGDFWTAKWTIKEEDLGEVQRIIPRKIREVRNTNGTHKFDEVLTTSTTDVWIEQEPVQKDTIVEYTFDTYSRLSYVFLRNSSSERYQFNFIEWTPSHVVFKAEMDTEHTYLRNYSLLSNGGVDRYVTSDGLPGIIIEMEPFVYGRCHNPNSGINFFSPKNLLKRNTRTTSFLCKGDPRWQPRDFLTIQLLDGSTRKTRIASIEIEHEGGGTQARVTCQDTNLY